MAVAPSGILSSLMWKASSAVSESVALCVDEAAAFRLPIEEQVTAACDAGGTS